MTYGKEFMGVRTTAEQILDLRKALKYLSVQFNEATYMFGDNEIIVNSSSMLKARLHEIPFPFHRLRELQMKKLGRYTNSILGIQKDPILKRYHDGKETQLILLENVVRKRIS